MSLGRINGPMLQPNLERQGVNIALDANLTYWDVNNRYVGINTTVPNYPLEVKGNVRAGNVYLLGVELVPEHICQHFGFFTHSLNLLKISIVHMLSNFGIFLDGGAFF